MVRTQIYLTEEERDGLSKLSIESGKKQSELIRDAIDWLIARLSKGRQQAILDKAAGLWKDRKDMPDTAALRAEWDRGHK